jgi:hypothetical protein
VEKIEKGKNSKRFAISSLIADLIFNSKLSIIFQRVLIQPSKKEWVIEN